MVLPSQIKIKQWLCAWQIYLISETHCEDLLHDLFKPSNLKTAAFFWNNWLGTLTAVDRSDLISGFARPLICHWLSYKFFLHDQMITQGRFRFRFIHHSYRFQTLGETDLRSLCVFNCKVSKAEFTSNPPPATRYKSPAPCYPPPATCHPLPATRHPLLATRGKVLPGVAAVSAI